MSPEVASMDPARVPAAIVPPVVASLSDKLGEAIPLTDGIPADEARKELALVDRVLSETLGGTPATEAIVALRQPRLDAYLLHCLRREILHAPCAEREPGAVLVVLRALDDILMSMGSKDLEDLHSRLMGPDAFELLVEVAHDLRSPLTSILFLAETLRVGHSGGINDVQRSQLGLIYSAALGLTSVVSDVLVFGRGGRGLIEPEPIPFSISEVMGGLQEMVAPMAEEKRIELRLKLPGLDRAYGHPAALGRVLLNLTTNALKFTDEGFVEVGIVPQQHMKLEAYVRDTGRGIDPSRTDLFQPFKKASQRDGHFFSGSGLGLTIVRRLVDQMGSELEIETAPGAGTRFSFVLESRPPREAGTGGVPTHMGH